jgi:hypothetical protein
VLRLDGGIYVAGESNAVRVYSCSFLPDARMSE